MRFEPGTIVVDKLEGDELFVVEHTEKEAQNKTAKYDFNKNEISVYELEKEKPYDCSPTDTIVTVVYKKKLIERFGNADLTPEQVAQKIEQKRIKPYYFPVTRLENKS